MMKQFALIGLAAGLAYPAIAQSSPPSGMVKTRTMPPTFAVTAPDYALKRFERPSETADAANAFITGQSSKRQGSIVRRSALRVRTSLHLLTPVTPTGTGAQRLHPKPKEAIVERAGPFATNGAM